MKRLLVLLVAFCAWPGHGTAADKAEDFYDTERMMRAREALRRAHGAQRFAMLMTDRFEYRAHGNAGEILWDAQGWYGSDEHKLWVTTEGEHASDEGELEDFEVQVLYSRAILPFWDLQAGLRHDIKPEPSRTHVVLGAQGLAPYWFEFDAHAFVSDTGDVSLRIETEYDLRLTQRLIVQPRLELNAAASGDRAAGLGSGLRTLDAGIRLRYQIVPEVSPYIGVSWTRAFGTTGDLADARQRTFVVAGLRLWY